MKDYLDMEYGEEARPYTDYPGKLCAYLSARFGLSPGMTLLEAGCGRGEFLAGFRQQGLDVYGADRSQGAGGFQPGMPVRVCDVEREALPFPDETFDVVYSKSLLEHLERPDAYIGEAWRVLKPGGLLITLVPDWESNFRIYFDDYTHRRPFSTVSVGQVYRLYPFREVEVSRFRQLPVTWKHPSVNYICAAISPFVPARTKNKFLRWSRELMIIGSGVKI